MKENKGEFLEIAGNKCPYCGEKSLVPSPRLKLFDNRPVTSIKISSIGAEQFLFGCKNCKRISYSFNEHL
jgi:hypothetical protein